MTRAIEWDFSDLETHGFTTCAHCHKSVTQMTALVQPYHNNTNTKRQETFCGVDCRNLWYLGQLRKGGL